MDKCNSLSAFGKPCKKDAVMETGQCLKHYYRDHKKEI